MKLPNPFRGLPNGREVWAWGMFDLANQSFTLLVITLLFPVYFKKIVVGDEARGDSLWSIIGSASLLMVVILSPFVGAAADAMGVKKRMLMTTGLLCTALTCSLAFIQPGGIWFAAALFMLANIAYQIGENLLAGFLPEISTGRNIGRVSATGWTMGYIGALLLLMIVIGSMLVLGLKDASSWRPFFVFAGVWFALGMIAPALILKEARPHALRGLSEISPERERVGQIESQGANPQARSSRSGLIEQESIVRVTLGRMQETIDQASHYKHLARFLVAFFVYGFGVQTMIYFAGIIARDFGFGDVKLVLFALQITVTAGIAAAATGFVQDRIGARTTVLIYLGVWIITAGGLFVLTLLSPETRAHNEWSFWLVGNGVGLGLGGIGTASRSMVGRFTPKHKTAEFFGLWGMTYKLAGVVGVLAFGQIKAWLGDPVAMRTLAGFFVVGLLLLLRVDEMAGVRAAKRAERGEGREDTQR